MDLTITNHTTEMAVLAVESANLSRQLENFIQSNDDPMKYAGSLERLEQLTEQLALVAAKCTTLASKL
jgi:hypothetical protein